VPAQRRQKTHHAAGEANNPATNTVRLERGRGETCLEHIQHARQPARSGHTPEHRRNTRSASTKLLFRTADASQPATLPVDMMGKVDMADEPTHVVELKHELGQRLADLRKAAGATQKDLARRTFVDRTYVSHAERAQQMPERTFWVTADDYLNAGGSLRAAYDELAAAQHAIKQAELDALRARHQVPSSPTFPGSRLLSQAQSGRLPDEQDDDLNHDEQRHMAAALQDARRFMDHNVVSYFRRQLDTCAHADGVNGAAPTLPRVLGILRAIETCAAEVRLSVLPELLSVAARGAEFAGWLFRDAHDASRARTWYSKATEYAQEANDTAMQGYVLLKKSQLAYDERDARHVLTLAQAAQYGPWLLSGYIRAEVTQQEARGLAMVGEPLAIVEQKLDDARILFSGAIDRDRHTQLGSPYSEDTLTLRDASCYIEVGRPHQAAVLYQRVLSADVLSRRDRGYYLARLTSSLALAGEPDEAAGTGLKAAQLATTTRSQRTRRELMRSLVTLKPWENRPGPRALRDAVAIPQAT